MCRIDETLARFQYNPKVSETYETLVEKLPVGADAKQEIREGGRAVGSGFMIGLRKIAQAVEGAIEGGVDGVKQPLSDPDPSGDQSWATGDPGAGGTTTEGDPASSGAPSTGGATTEGDPASSGAPSTGGARTEGDPASSGAQTPGPVSSEGDGTPPVDEAPTTPAGLLDELERLERLHRSGGLTDAEYAQAKARVLAP
nr:hypothetical protein [Actinomycetales bacterium]